MATKKRKRRESFGAVRQLPSKRYQASYVGPDGNRYTAPLTFTAMDDARAWLARRRIEIADGLWSPHEAQTEATAKATRVVTFADYAEQYISTRTNRHGAHLSPRTAEEYRRLVKRPLAPFADSRLSAVTPDAVRSWYSDLISSGKKTQAARAYELLKAIFSTAVQDGRVKANPCQIRGGASASTGKKTVPPTPAELAKMLEVIAPRYRAAVLLGAWAGVRYGELTELRRKDLERVGDVYVVNVSRGVTHVTGHGAIVGPTKSEAGVRSIVLPPHVTGDIEAHLDEHVGGFPDALLFPAKNGVKHLRESSFTKHWYPAREAAGREDLPFHGLRHYGATRFALTGATLKEIQSRLGHSTVAAAMRYQHAVGRDEELARRMSDLA
ncbi:tyrosine-type recombinase/integrase [Microbacterium sp. CCNWLW134]|uniref:tyrosine-type recombinase/integrase n=1 Tax=Microbacterium sp. CCNWLW134 TaxID=3122064 RepID=UPI003010392D